MLDRPDDLKWSIWTVPEIPIAYKSKICFIGDVAHDALPMHAAGAGQATEDAPVISHVLGAVTDVNQIEAAFRVYNKIRLLRAQRNPRLSAEAVEVYSTRKPQVLNNHDALVKAMEHRMDWLWNRDVALDGEQAVLIVNNISKG